MRIIDRMDMQLRSARDALERIHVLGAESGLMDGALCAIGDVIKQFGMIMKEEAKKGENQGKGEGVQGAVDLHDGERGKDAADDRAGERVGD